jgi:fructosamine-3-kinase
VTPFVKTRLDAPPGFFAAEARGLQWLADVDDGPPLPEVLDVTQTSITLTRIDQTQPTREAAESFGPALAAMHRAGAPRYGAEWPGYIGPLPMDNGQSDSWPEWYAEHRVLPYLRMAVDRGAVSATDAGAVEALCGRLPPSVEPPARIHGDLWSGNLLWGVDGQCWLIDPAAHGGHRETDLAMLALFGAPHLERVVAAYDAAWPLEDGWRERVGIHQLHPLLVHAVLFGAGYGDRAAAIARKY